MPRRLGNYELLKKIGTGGMAEVWMGRRAGADGLSKAVAVKLLTGGAADDPSVHRMFTREARVSMLLSHSNIAQVFDVGTQDGRDYLVMEWVDGLNLAQLGEALRGGGLHLPVHVAAYVVGEVAQALAYAHTVTHEGATLGIVHRDVSPQNVLVSVSGEVKLADFGIAKLAHVDTTGTGRHAKGKLRYMSPEQLQGRARAPTVDLYALGAVLHELLSGEKFRDGSEPEALYGEILGGTIPALDVAGVPAELERLRVALLQPDAADRPQTAAAVLEALEAWPGYRTAAAELGKTCKMLLGVDAPRSGLYAQARNETPASSPAEPDTAGATATAPTRTWVDSGVHVPSSEVDPVRPAVVEPGTRRARSAVGLVAVGALVGVVGLAALYGLREREPAEPIATPDPAAAAKRSSDPGHADAPVQVGAPAAPGSPSPARAASAGDTTSSVSAKGAPTAPVESPSRADAADPAAGTPGPAEEPVAKPVKKRRRPKVPVNFLLDGPRTAYVRIDGRRTLTLQPRVDTELTVGRHRLSWRTAAHDPWKPGGTITLEPGHDYIVDITDSGPRLSVSK